MSKNKKNNECCETGQATKDSKCCNVDAVISIDERGQIVLPKDVREKAEIKAGDKLAVISCECGGTVSLIALAKTEAFEGIVKSMLGPIVQENNSKKKGVA